MQNEDIAEYYDSKRGEWENEKIKRNEGSEKNTGQRWKRATKVIGEAICFVKRPDIWYQIRANLLHKARGCQVIDLDGNKLNDLFDGSW